MDHTPHRTADAATAPQTSPALTTRAMIADQAFAATGQGEPPAAANETPAQGASVAATVPRLTSVDSPASTPAAVTVTLATPAQPPAGRHMTTATTQPDAPQAPALQMPVATSPATPVQAAAISAAPVPALPTAAPVTSPPALTSSTATPTSAELTASASAVPNTPAQQAASALVSFGGSQGTHHVTVQLNPLELGRLQIRIDQPNDGAARVTLTAERPQTLDLLVHDQGELQRALDQAGVPAEGRSVTFHLAAATPDLQADPSRTASPPPSSGSAAGDLSGGSHGGAQQGPQREGSAAGQPRMAGGSPQQDDTPRAARWLRTGIDITA